MELELALEVIEENGLNPFEVCELLDKRRIVRALKLHGWNQCAAAEDLKMHRNTLSRRMVELGVEIPAEGLKRGYRPRGMRKSMVVANGLGREITPLAARIRLRQAYAAKHMKQDVEEIVKIEQMNVLTGIMAAKKKQLA